MSHHIFHGVWINWSHGPVGGATLTLGEREGGLLIAFVAFFVTLVGAQLFKILNYIFHQVRSRRAAKDGLHHQQQVIFRNAASPFSSAWNFLQQSWAWNNKARRSLIRTLPWVFFCLVYMIAFGLAAVFSSEITKSPGSARLIIGDNCGYWMIDDVNYTSADTIKAYAGRSANLSLANDAYVRQCYGGSPDSLNCGKMVKPAIATKKNVNASCPFADGMCATGKDAAFEIMSERMDSLYDLGINSRHSDRLQFQKIATCAPLIQDGFVEAVAGGAESGRGREGDMLYLYNYGPSQYTGGEANITDYTEFYNNHTAIDAVGYKLSSTYWTAGLSYLSGWKPVPELNQTDADLTIMFLSQNAITYSDPVDDPMFSAHIANDLSSVLTGVTYYSADFYVNVMGCIDQYQICNPENGECTGFMGVYQLTPYLLAKNKMDLNTVQTGIAVRMINHAFQSGIYSSSYIQAENGLLAKDSLADQLSQGLPNNQWQIEVENIFNKGLASIQLAIVEYAEGPPIGRGATLLQPWINNGPSDSADNLVAEAMCESQMINDSSDSISFSLVGLIIVFAFGGFIIFLSVILDTAVGWIQRRFNIGTHARVSWLLDDKLQLHRYLNEELGQGNWHSDHESFPITLSPQEFDSLVASRQRGVGRSQTGKVHYAGSSPDMSGPVSMDEPSAPAYQGPGFSGRGYTQVTTTEEHWHAK